MRTDVLCRHYKQHWEAITKQMGQEACRKQIDTLCTLLYKVDTSKSKPSYQWAFCAACGKGEARGDREKVTIFMHDHAMECSGKFDEIKYMFDHSIPKPKQVRAPKISRTTTVSENAQPFECEAGRAPITTITLEKLRKRFPSLLTNEDRNKEYARAKLEDPDGDHDIDDFDDDRLKEFDTLDKALARIFEHYEHVRQTGERDATRVEILKKTIEEKKVETKDLVAKNEMYRRNMNTLQEQMVAMRNKVEAMEKSIAARDQIFIEYGIKDHQIEHEVSHRIADHLNSFRK